MSEPTAKDVSAFMLERLREDGTLYQDVIVCQIQEHFGDDFVYENDNGNLAIDRGVLKEFRALTKVDVVWSRSERFWRFREDYNDAESRMVDS